MTDKPTPTDAATPECLTCSDHGAVGNILTAEPCPDCTRWNVQPAPATQQAGERVYAFRRKGLADFCTCDEARYEELSNKPHLFETRIFYTAPQPVAREPLPKFLALKFHARRDKKAAVTLLFPGHEAADAWVRGIRGGLHGTE